MKKFWRDRWYNVDSIGYTFCFKTDEGFVKNKINEAINRFLQIGAQYHLFEPLELSEEDFLRSIIEPVNGFFNGDQTLSNFIELGGIHLESLGSTIKIPKLCTTIPFPYGDKVEMIRLPLVPTAEEPWIHHIAYIYIGVYTRNEFPFYMGFSSHSDIWWADLEAIAPEGASRFREFLNNPLDNRPFAYRITPRLNSFVRDMNAFTLNLGGKIYYDRANQYCTEEGVLLDGKIIYQEDIDEGRVVPPNEYREMDPETIEKLKRYDLL